MGKSDKYYYQSKASEDDDDLDVDPNELIYSLEIVQQPLRARMCGFGDKDRRNVTPAPVLKLVAKMQDGKIVSASHLSKQAFVVTADLWLEDEVTERNLVLISSIPSSRTAAYSLQQATLAQESQLVVDQLGIHEHTPEGSSSYLSTTSSPVTAESSSNASRMSIRNVIHDVGVGSAEDADTHEEQEYHQDNDTYVEQDLRELRELSAATSQARMEMSTRNLVGQIAVSGQVAPGLDDEISHIWFAFSILSIRTEGFFKIRFCLTDLMRIPEGGTSETICQVFSNTIHVQTPKKFEGTCGTLNMNTKFHA
ncbi:hypothetical protein BGZ79_000093 [Entomortierella chlamydospora]|nr:hypothetical protein BGZ79_000093 [Entomortierella chlamydospora]